MTRKQIEEYLENFKWKWSLEIILDDDHIFSCWRLKGFGNGSQICLIQDWDREMNIKGPLSVTADGKKTVIRRFSKKMAVQLATISDRLLKDRIRAQKRHAKRAK